MHRELASAVPSFSALIILLLYLGAVALAFALPFMALSVTLNIRRTRRAVERIAEALESRGRTSGAGVLGL